MKKMKDKYLQKGRLQDVIAMLSFLALNNSDEIEGTDIEALIESKAKSSKSWILLVKDHPEFFHFDSTNKTISLSIRHHEPGKLNINQTFTLIETANSLHDRELQRRNRNAYLIPLYVAILSILFSAYTLYHNGKNLEDNLKEIIKTELLDKLK